MPKKLLYWLISSDYPKLVVILGFALFIAFIPHRGTPYPVHLDEWNHLAYSEQVIEYGTLTYPDPFTGQMVVGAVDSGVEMGPHLYVGYYSFWAIFKQISGLDWFAIYKYFPAAFFVITVLSVYIFARRERFGWEAALLTCMLLTTPGILGPGFLVPLSLGLMFIPLVLYLAYNHRTIWSYLAIFISFGFLLSIHAVTAVGLALILLPFFFLNLKKDFKHSLGIGLAVLLPFFASFPWISRLLFPTLQSILQVQEPLAFVELPILIEEYGFMPILLCVGGIAVLAFKGGKKYLGLVLGLLVILLVLVMYFRFNMGIPILYFRGLMYLMLMMGIVAGAGLWGARIVSLPENWIKAAWPRRNIGNILCVSLIAITLLLAIPARLNIPYYYMIDDNDYEAFVWIRDNLDESYARAVLDPWKGTAFTAVTQRMVYSRIRRAPNDADRESAAFIREGCADTGFLRENDISIVYTAGECNNPDLLEVRENVYILQETAGGD